MDFLGATEYGLVFYAVISLLLFALLTAKIKSLGKSREGRIVALAIAFAIGFLFLGPIAANMIQPFVPVQLIQKGADINVMTEEGGLKITLVDAVTGQSVTSGKVYLLKGFNYDLKVFDQIKKGTLKAGTDYFVLTTTDGTVTFQGVTGSRLGITYTVIYEPSSFANNGYPLYMGKVVAYGLGDNNLLRASGSTVMLYKLSPVSVFDPTGTARGSYTMTTTSFDLAARFGPTTQNTAMHEVYIYTNRSDTLATEFFVYVNGQEISFVKLANLESTSPLLKNAPTGATYVTANPVVVDPVIYDSKVDIRIKGSVSSNCTITLTFVHNAGVEYADVTLGTFKIKVDTAGTAGWGS